MTRRVRALASRGLPRVGPILALGLLLAALAGCGILWSRDEADGPVDDNIYVRIENQNFYDATIHIFWNSERRRLGWVVGNTEETFTTPYRFGALLSFEVTLLAGPSFTTDPMSVGPGEEVIVTIPPQIDRIRW
jgi:hypothetical protein